MSTVGRPIMGQSVSDLEELIAEFRPMLPSQSKTAQAIDRRDPFEEIAHKAIDEGYIQFVDQFGKFMEICLRRVT
ncbi:MAG: CBS domain-containing protein [Betaproteobacteria bacterium]|nr:MAG: CBS domain-containing protein [Betaproteobacteria bacterium]